MRGGGDLLTEHPKPHTDDERSEHDAARPHEQNATERFGHAVSPHFDCGKSKTAVQEFEQKTVRGIFLPSDDQMKRAYAGALRPTLQKVSPEVGQKSMAERAISWNFVPQNEALGLDARWRHFEAAPSPPAEGSARPPYVGSRDSGREIFHFLRES